MIVAVLQAIYIVWMLAVADFASVWVVMVVFALVSAAYAAATAIALATPLQKPMLLEMGQYRDQAPSWCGAVLLVTALATYLTGRIAARWRRAFQLEMGTLERGKATGRHYPPSG